MPIGFSVVIPSDGKVYELDGLFVEPGQMHRGVGRALVEGAAERTARDAAACLEVTAGPAQGFYEKVGFIVVGDAETRFGPASRMRRDPRCDASGQASARARDRPRRSSLSARWSAASGHRP